MIALNAVRHPQVAGVADVTFYQVRGGGLCGGNSITLDLKYYYTKLNPVLWSCWCFFWFFFLTSTFIFTVCGGGGGGGGGA